MERGKPSLLLIKRSLMEEFAFDTRVCVSVALFGQGLVEWVSFSN